MDFGSQLKLLLWKNWILQKRRICVSVFEIFLPVFFAVLLLLIRQLIGVRVVSTPTTYDRHEISSIFGDLYQPHIIIGFAPETSETRIVMKDVLYMINKEKIPAIPKNYSVKGFQTEKLALDFIKSNSKKMRHLVVFDGVSASNKTLPKKMDVSIRPYTGRNSWNTKSNFPFSPSSTPSTNYFSESGGTKEFHLLQRLVGESLTKYWVQKNGRESPSSDLFKAFTQRMPYPPYTDDAMIEVFRIFLPIALVIGFFISVIINTLNLVYEKERKLKESMKLMGMRASVHWVSWFITFLIYLVPVLALYTICLGISFSSDRPPVLANTDPSLFFVFLLCYGLALISFCFMVSTFVQKANIGAVLAGILFNFSQSPWAIVQSNYESMGKITKLAAGLFINTGASLGTQVISLHEGTGEGAQWNNFYKPAVPDDNISLLDTMLLLLFTSLLQFGVAWYLDNVRPGEYGVPKPFYFPFTKSYWCGSEQSTDSVFEYENSDTKHFEKDPTGLHAGIQIAKLKKTFGRKVAVDGISLKMYDGQITALLGHNGAGKTTTMSMLTGFIPPTSGTAQVNGYDIRENIQGVRTSLGLCPQHNILFDSLTVKEHLIFFAKLKGVNNKDIEREVTATVSEIGLEAKLHDRSQSLSGGQKRKLSLGIALIGGSKIVILDEPTSGMDPAARRQTWGVLKRAKQDRTVVLSTHYMDEADVLGDRIAIMSEGVVKCCGSSMFLKKLYGAGYHLTVVKHADCNVDALTRAVQTHTPTAVLESVINTEVRYLLPESECARFPALFTELDKAKDKLGITSFGTSATTMEDVFLKVGENAYDDEGGPMIIGRETLTTDGNESNDGDDLSNLTAAAAIHDANKKNHGNTAYSSNAYINMAPGDLMSFNKGFLKNTGLSLQLSKMRGIFVKKALHTFRNRIVTLMQIAIPPLILMLALAPAQIQFGGEIQEPALRLDLKPFGDTYIPTTAGLDPTPERLDMIALYENQFGKAQTMEEFTIPPYDFNNYTAKRASQLGTSVYNKKMLVGLELEDLSPKGVAAVAFYNGEPYHAKAVSINYMMNTHLQSALNDSSYSLQFILHPLPKDPKFAAEQASTGGLVAGLSIGISLNFSMAFLTSLFIYFLIKERQAGAKHLQIVSGVGPITYWVPTFLWDFINYIVPCFIILIVFAAFSKNAYIDDGRFALVIFVFALYGWAVLPCMYAVQFIFKSPATGVVLVIIMYIITGAFTLVAVLIVKLPFLNLEILGNALDWIFMLLFSNYNMASCFSRIQENYGNLELCGNAVCLPNITSLCCKESCDAVGVCLKYEKSYLAWESPGIGSNVLVMIVQGVVFFTLVMLVEYHIIQKLWYMLFGIKGSQVGKHDANLVVDSDVAAEEQRINELSPEVLRSTVHYAGGPVEFESLNDQDSSDALVLVNLYKRYRNLTAVDHISVGIPAKECFGLLGQNGAGKTTTFKMLTGDVMVTGGNAYLKGYDVRDNIKKVQANMGYCPQFDALIDQMTGRETLTMYARLRGVPESSITTVVESLMDILLLTPYADKLAGNFSGGNKRKLSTAMAIIGDPPFIMLDEPSCGIDPMARRQLWKVLSQVRASGRTLVLTSHSMEECDALCTRLAIMVNGRFVCLGSPQHLKNKFGQGYTLMVQMGALADGSIAPTEPVTNFIIQNFPGSMVFEGHQGFVHFQVPDASIKLAQVFSLMESTKTNLCVQDYAVHQTTLEQIFLTFTRVQTAPKES